MLVEQLGMYSKELRTTENISATDTAQQVLSDFHTVLSDFRAAQECERKRLKNI